MSEKSQQVAISLEICPQHGVRAIMIGSLNGRGGTTRITASKCCGTWLPEYEFTVWVADIEDAIRDALGKGEQDE